MTLPIQPASNRELRFSLTLFWALLLLLVVLIYHDDWQQGWVMLRDGVAQRVAQWIPEARVTMAPQQKVVAALHPKVAADSRSAEPDSVELKAQPATVGDVIASLSPAPLPRPTVTVVPAVRPHHEYFIQLAAFGQQADAEKLAQALLLDHERPQVSHHGQWWQVRLLGFRDRRTAEALAKKLARRFYIQPIVRRGS
ncbi:MAG: SPOR domain-containing protein [Mariprofundales bacterium]|nr:SPOR domain-containing protein [Mariprofundales bacterium]